MKKKNLTSLSEFIDKEVGKKGTKKRDKFEDDYDAFKLGVLIQQTRTRIDTRTSSRIVWDK